jgi:tetratricopeptide (TPR) repeat protein
MLKKLLLLLCFVFLCVSFSTDAFGQKPTESTNEAIKLVAKGDTKGAIAVLDKAIGKKKDLFEAYRLRGFLRQGTGDYAGAVEDLSNALEINPQAADLYEQRALMRLMLRQDTALILKDLDAAIAYGVKLERIYTLRASIKRQMGDNEGAISDYQAVIGLRPDYASAHVGLASIYLISGDEDKAASILENYIYFYENPDKRMKVEGKVVGSDITVLQPRQDATNPNITVLQPQMKQTETIIGKSNSQVSPNESIDKLEQAKNTSLAYTNLASIYNRKKEFEKALATVEKGIRIDEKDFYAREVRGRIRLNTGNYQGAIDDLNAAIKAMPNMFSAYLERGIAYFLLGNGAEAQKDFDKYLQMFPNGKTNLERRLEEAKAMKSGK